MDDLLRRAGDSDREYLYLVFRETMRAVIEATWGWDESWQRTEFEKRFVTFESWVIQSEGVPVGGLVLERRVDAFYVHEVGVLPEYQGRGLGTAVVRWVVEQAANRGLPVTLSVVSANARAQRLYERLGFQVTAFEPPFFRMRRHSAPSTR